MCDVIIGRPLNRLIEELHKFEIKDCKDVNPLTDSLLFVIADIYCHLMHQG